MEIGKYKYTVEQCSVPVVRHNKLRDYRAFREKCLTYLRGSGGTSVFAQLRNIAWYTVLFKTLNAARELEVPREINGPMWELMTVGYTNFITLGIRRLVDSGKRTDSLLHVVAELERQPAIITREAYVCYDGLPFDGGKARRRNVAEMMAGGVGAVRSLDTEGPEAWGMSELMHKAFDRLCLPSAKGRYAETLDPAVIASLRAQLESPQIRRVCDMASQVIAHAERIDWKSAPISTPTYDDIDEAMRILNRVANFISTAVFQDRAMGAVVPTPQYDVLHNLDAPWILPENLPALRSRWTEIKASMDSWAEDSNAGFLPP